MGKSVNKIILLGNVGSEPEIRTTAGGAKVASFSLATAERTKDASGTWSDKTEWHSLVAFQRNAEIVRDYVRKGHKLYVEGRLQTQSWTDKVSGTTKYKTEIIVNEIVLIAGRDEPNRASSSKVEDPIYDDIPF